ncbi:hypothetical protein [Shinella sp. G-2]|uniref:hypothetical protein n=1 Tax=Shinella sp. G-2 TaxID=3133141 RepID=UPI003D086AAF
MPLKRKDGASVPKELGLFWPMLTPEGTIIDIYVYASTLQMLDTAPGSPVGLLKRNRALLETIASRKYDREGAPGDALHLNRDDVMDAKTGDTETDPGSV